MSEKPRSAAIATRAAGEVSIHLIGRNTLAYIDRIRI